jgi:PTH1 family peptidyl-tRNA hydrolase
MHLIAGLGNPGKAYARTRHNLGFMVIEALGEAHNIPIRKKQDQAQTGQGTIEREKVLLAKPQTYMNLSGQAIEALLRRYKLPLSQLLVLQDDLDIPFGRIKIALRGGGGGHRGMESILDYLDTREFLRLKIGIGPRPIQVPLEDYVLSPFTKEESPLLPGIIERAREAVELILEAGPQAAMNKIHFPISGITGNGKNGRENNHGP